MLDHSVFRYVFEVFSSGAFVAAWVGGRCENCKILQKTLVFAVRSASAPSAPAMRREQMWEHTRSKISLKNVSKTNRQKLEMIEFGGAMAPEIDPGGFRASVGQRVGEEWRPRARQSATERRPNHSKSALGDPRGLPKRR